jgi:hypothetical protein
MHVRYVALVLCLLSISALGQSPTQASTSLQTPIHGIKIFSSNFDVATQTVKLDFMNDSPSDITAWGYCVKATKANSDDPDQSMCTFRDALPAVIDEHIQEQITLKASRSICEDCYFIRSGQHKTISATFSAGPVANGEIEIYAIVRADGTTETSGKIGAHLLQEISADRQTALKTTQLIVVTGQDILADKSNQHPVVSMMDALQKLSKTEPSVEGFLYFFKRPEWRKANRTEFIPEDERRYLRSFVQEQQTRNLEFSKHQIGGGSE